MFVKSTATRRTSPVGAAYSARDPKPMPPLRGFRFFVHGLAKNMSLLAEFGIETAMEHEVAP